MTPISALLLPAVLLLAWLLMALPYGLSWLDLVGGLAAAAAGVLAGAAWPGLRTAAPRLIEAVDELLGVDTPAREPRRAPMDGDPDRLDAGSRRDALGALLRALAVDLEADRVVLWRVDREADRVVPEIVHGDPPPPGPAVGNALAWAHEERSPMQLDPAPRWARGAAAVAPVDDHRVVTVECPGRKPPKLARVGWAGSMLGPVLALHDRQADAEAASARFESVVAFLRSVPGQPDAGLLPATLARAGIEVAGGAGALVAAWSGDEGVVLAREGTGGGPAPGTTFGALDGDLAHAARTGAPLQRGPEAARRPGLIVAEEPRGASSPHRVVVPLVDPAGATRGLVAVWGARAPARHGVSLLQALGPLLALHLAQASDLDRFRERASADALTGLHNRATFDERMQEVDALFDRYRRPVSLLVLDLDHFKDINDRWGHDAGDTVLQQVARTVRATIRDVDFPARYGGEEFVVVLPETMLRAGLDAGERIRAAIEALAIRHGDSEIPVTVSVGVSACPECVDDPSDLFTSADEALYRSKEEGRNRVTAAPTRTEARR